MKNREKTLKTIERLIEVVEELRSDHGCPWDRLQTHESLRMQLIEEAYEACDAMLRYETKGEVDNLKEELGDILLQIVFHGVLAEEENIFTIDDIAEEITAKMIHRHPHVFKREEWEKQQEKKSWEQLKAEEKGHGKENARPLRGIPRTLPALMKMAKLLKKADAVYHCKTNKEDSLQQLALLSDSLRDASDEKQTEKIMTTMLYHMCNIAWQDKINLEELLMKQTDKVIEALEPEEEVTARP